MYVALSLAVLVQYVAAGPWFEMSQARHIKADLDLGRDIEHIFHDFKVAHNKKYEENEEEVRKQIFTVNVKHIKEHNQKYQTGEKSYYLGVNQFTDMTHKEFLDTYMGHMGVKESPNATTFLSPDNILLPDEVDWRKKGYVTPVKDQGQCGSCWSFSATGSLEGQHFKKTGTLLSLSEQQLVDCSGSYGNQGCNGGLMDQAFEYLKAVGGDETEDEYPYEAREESRCHWKKSAPKKATVSGYVDIESGSEKKLQEALATVGPVSVAIDASHQSFQMYAGGVYDEPECSSSELDHGVLVVGYGTLDGKDYWLVKNSWNTSWGDEGYIRMSRNKDNQCGIATQASYPLV